MSRPPSLAALVNAGGLVPYRPEDFYFVLKSSSQEPERLILVGGQALEVWGVYLSVAAPTSANSSPFQALTMDADWLGNHEDAKWLAEQLGVDRTEVIKPSLDDPTVNSAILYLGRDGGVMMMDFLRQITGLSNQDIAKQATDLRLPAADGTTLQLRVLDPIHCLASRMANLKTHESKRQENGVAQAHWALDIVQAYLRQLVAEGLPPDKLARQCRRVTDLAQYGPAEFCFTHYGIQPAQCIGPDVVQACGHGFENQEWPMLLTRIGRVQDKWNRNTQRRAERRQQL